MSLYQSNVVIEGHSEVLFTENQAHCDGGAIILEINSNLLFYNNCAIVFNGNKAENGGAVYLYHNSIITFRDHSLATLTNNTAIRGGGILAKEKSNVYFEKNSMVYFNNNTAKNLGGAIISSTSTVKVRGYSKLTFYNNVAGKGIGGAVYIVFRAAFILEDNCIVTFNSNRASSGGGVVIWLHSIITIKENSTVDFNGNSASKYGGALCSTNSCIYFEGKSLIKFSNNKASECGALCVLNLKEYNDFAFETYPEEIFVREIITNPEFLIQNSSIIFKENCKVLFCDNQAKEKGGAIHCSMNSYVAITNNSRVEFDNNQAQVGGATYFGNQSNFTIDDCSLVIFNSNTATLGGSIFVEDFGVTKFKGNSLVYLNTNRAADRGGAIMSQNTSVVRFEEQSKVTFQDNTATTLGGAIYIVKASCILFTQYSTLLFYNNSAKFGESIYTNYNSFALITTNSTVRFNNNTARWYGDIPYSNIYGYTDVVFDSNGIITCSDQEILPVCIHQKCFCEAIDSVLATLTNNTQIDLSINVTLSSIITLSGHVNISIIGHHNPTINCIDGGLKFIHCHDCAIEGITWDGCGTEYINGNIIPVIEFYKSTNISVQNCTFQHSIGQAVTLSDVSGNVKINHCSFQHNKHYKGHGTAVYFSSSNNQNITQQTFTISNSNFTKNEGTNSIIYTDHYNKFNLNCY